MPSHDVGHILENLQILDLQLFTVIGLALVRCFQLGQVLENVPFELDAVEARNRGGGTEPYLLAAYQYSFFLYGLFLRRLFRRLSSGGNIHRLVPAVIDFCVRGITGAALDQTVFPRIGGQV